MRNIREFEAALLNELIRNGTIDTAQRAKLLREKNAKKIPLLEVILKDEYKDAVSSVASFMTKAFSARELHEDETVNPTSGDVEDEIFKKYGVFTAIHDEKNATVYFCEPIYDSAWREIAELLERDIERVIIGRDLCAELREKVSQNIKIKENFAISSQNELRNIPQSKRAISFVSEVLSKCIHLNASDVHVEPQKHNFRIRMRLNGVLQTFGEYDSDFFPAFSSRLKLVAGLNIAEKRETQDGAILHTYTNPQTGEETDIPFRVSVMPTIYGEKIVLRKLGGDATITLTQLGMSREILEPWSEIISKGHGIILVSGPTGSGKSTTLQAAINEIKSDKINISTVEDPVETKIPGVNQVQIDSHKISFSDALRALLRQDPDVIMVGEIRDTETAEIALRASLTGHMVYSTIHTNDAPSTVTRLVDMGVEPFLVSSSVLAVLAQRLSRVLCDSCKEQYVTNEAEMSILGLEEPCSVYRATGCPKCNNTGYTGRVGVYELLIVDTHIQRMINEGESDIEIKKYAVETLHMRTLFDEVKKHFLEGRTSFEEVKRII